MICIGFYHEIYNKQNIQRNCNIEFFSIREEFFQINRLCIHRIRPGFGVKIALGQHGKCLYQIRLRLEKSIGII